MPTQQRQRAGGPPADTHKDIEKKGTAYQVGNLTKDPELRYAGDGKAYCRFGLAVERPKVPGEWSGERVTTFYEVTCFGDMAEHAAQSLAKGTRALVIGRGELEHWTDKAGVKQTSKRIVADAIGPDLRWAVAEVTKVTRQGPAADQQPDTYDDEEPF